MVYIKSATALASAGLKVINEPTHLPGSLEEGNELPTKARINLKRHFQKMFIQRLNFVRVKF